MKRTDIRNVAVIAHVDHGKTTLVDQMLRQSGQFRSEELDKLVGGQHGLIMDSNDQERERGITILAKNCGIRIGDVKVNLIDTPGHADFGGEVERILKMADGAFVLVDSAEGPLPQTRFVLRKAFACGLKPIVIINKIDRPDARIDEIHSQMFDLFIELGADDDTANFPVIYASGRAGIATTDMAVEPKDLMPLFDAIIEKVPAPEVEEDAPLQMQVMALSYSEFVGKIAVCKVFAGKARKNQRVTVVKQKDGSAVADTIVQLLEFERLGKKEIEEIRAGDVCAVRRHRRRGHRRHDLRVREADGAARAVDRRADARHAVPRQRLAVRRPAGQAADQPRVARPARQGTAIQRRPARQAGRPRE